MHAEIELCAVDGGRISAYAQLPKTARRGLVVIQEVFGVTTHIKSVVDDFAAAGYAAVAPRFFDRIEPGITLNCDDAGMARGRECVAHIGFDAALRDVRAAALSLQAHGCASVGVVGYCWGGVVAYLAATRLALPAVSYYGRLVPSFLHESLQAPLQFHFGERDALIPLSAVDQIALSLPKVALFRYPAGHAFNRLDDPHGDPSSAALARQRCLAFFAEHLGEP